MTAILIWFRELDKWGIPKSLRLAPKLPSGWVWAKIEDLAKQISDRVRVEPENEYKLIGVKWYGEGTFHRETVTGREISATYLTPVKAGAFIYNRLFAWKTSFAVVPKQHDGYFVSGEFPQFQLDESRVLPEFLYLLFRLDRTIKLVTSTSSGSAAVSRNRFKENEFSKFEVALPPLETQRVIISRWHEAQRAIAQAEKRVDDIQQKAFLAIKQKLGRISNEDSKRSKAFALNWSQVERWGVEIARQFNRSSVKHLYPILRVADLCKIGSGGTPPRKYPQYFKGEIPWVKTTEVRDNVILDTGEHVSRDGLENSSAKIHPKGSLIIAMYGQGATRGRTAKLGIDAATNQACAVLTNFDKRINQDYLWVYLMSEYNELRLMASGNNQPNLNAEMIANYDVPLPSLKIQEDIVSDFMNARAEIARQKQLAEKIRKDSETEIEALILGTKKI